MQSDLSINQSTSKLSQIIIHYYEQTRAPWNVLQPFSQCLLDLGEKEFRKLVGKSPAIWLPELKKRLVDWSNYTEVRQDNWQRRAEKFIQWYQSEENKLAQKPNSISKNTFPVTYDSPNYPPCLREIDEPPPVLYANHPWDKWAWPERRLSVIGSRNMSPYGKQVTTEIVQELVNKYQVGVVSGGARGVDICSQQAALSAKGQTIGVLGCGLNKVTSWQQKKLLTHPKSLWISEFPPNFSAQNWTFVQRNRLIAGLGQGLLVVEAQEKSGTMITVSYALEQGKEVCVIPQNLWNKNASGIVRLANNGATLVKSANEIASLVWGFQESHLEQANQFSAIEQQILQKLRENEGTLSLADLIYSCPDKIEQAQWQATVIQLQSKQIIKVDLGTVHCQSMIKS